MKLFMKGNKTQIGQLGEPILPSKETIDSFHDAVTPESERDKQPLYFQGEVDDKPLAISLPKGTWGIMESLIPMILKYCPGDIVEVGMGESTTIFARYAAGAGVSLYSCDIQVGGMFQVFDKELFDNHYCYIGRSEEFMQEYSGSPSIVFLDGEHLYETVKKEVEFFLPIMRVGGVMFLHDTMPMFKKNIEPDEKGYNPGDIYKVRQELERDPRYDVFTWPYSALNMGLTMVMVHGDSRPHWKRNGRVDETN